MRSACFTGCGKYVVTVSDDDNHSVKVWEWESGKCLATAKGDANPIYLRCAPTTRTRPSWSPWASGTPCSGSGTAPPTS